MAAQNGLLWRVEMWPNLTFSIFLLLLLIYTSNHISISESVRPTLLFGNTLREMQNFMLVYASVALIIYLLPIGSFGGIGIIISFAITEYFTNYTTYCNECVTIQLFVIVLMVYFFCLSLSARLKTELVELCEDTGGDLVWGHYNLRGYQPELYFVVFLTAIPIMQLTMFLYGFFWSIWLLCKLHPADIDEEHTQYEPTTSTSTI